MHINSDSANTEKWLMPVFQYVHEYVSRSTNACMTQTKSVALLTYYISLHYTCMQSTYLSQLQVLVVHRQIYHYYQLFWSYGRHFEIRESTAKLGRDGVGVMVYVLS